MTEGVKRHSFCWCSLERAIDNGSCAQAEFRAVQKYSVPSHKNCQTTAQTRYKNQRRINSNEVLKSQRNLRSELGLYIKLFPCR